MSLATWLGFLLAAVMIAVTPGPGAVLSMSTGGRHGYWAAFIAILGLQVAILVHLLIVAVGFGALLAASETAFFSVKLMGAAYLVWLGIAKWRAPLSPVDGNLVSLPRGGFFLQGLLVNLINPKAIIFIGALVPQFINPAQPVLAQYLIVAATLSSIDVVTMSVYALAAVRMNQWMHNPKAIQLQNRTFGGLFFSAGVFLAGSARP
ncbi:MAG: LysE family transporter [Betaproteobacteria bacterium]|nr:LysE family transporter [Betaproteobacteria bacterium]